MGRRDSLTASQSAANNDIPSPVESLENITKKFTTKGLDIKDMVVLSGKTCTFFVTLVTKTCTSFVFSLYNTDRLYIIPLRMFHAGAHTIGFAQCLTFKSRLFNFNGAGNPDPNLDTSLLSTLQNVCPNQDSSDSNLAPLDAVTTNRFDNVYYKNLVNNSGLLGSDQALMGDTTTASMVINYSKYPYLFSQDFGSSMVKLGKLGVLTGKDGEIRKNCRVIN